MGKQFDKDREEVIRDSLKEGVGLIITGTDLKSNQAAVDYIGEKMPEKTWCTCQYHLITVTAATAAPPAAAPARRTGNASGGTGADCANTKHSRKLIAGLYMVGSQVRAIIRRTKRKLITRAAAGSIRAVCPAMTQPQYNPMMIPAMVMGLTPMYPSGNMVMPTPIATPGSTLCTPNMD